MKRLIAIVLLIVCLSGCTDTIKTDNNSFIGEEEYGDTFGQDWLDATDGATQYPGNIDGYYENKTFYPVKYNIYFQTGDYWIHLDGENALDANRQLMQVPAYIWLKKVDDKYTVTAMTCEFDRMIEAE